jgi:branched-chain amino acid transport system permease protein
LTNVLPASKDSWFTPDASGRLDTASRAWGKYAIGMIALLIPSALLVHDGYWLNILTFTYLMAGLATAWNIIGGFGGQFSAGHAVFFGISAYLTARFYLLGISPWISLPLGGILAAVVAVPIFWPTFRLRGPFFAIATMGLNEVALSFANYSEKITGGAQGILIPFQAGFLNMIFTERWKYAILMYGFMVLTVAVALIIRRGKIGYYLLALREDEDAAKASGVNTLRIKLWGMAISAFLTGMGGTLFTMFIRFIDPPTLFTLPEMGIKFALIALVGGIGTISGPILGAALVIPLENYLRASMGGLPGVHLVILSLLLILVALFMKRGIIGALGALRRRIWRAAQ